MRNWLIERLGGVTWDDHWECLQGQGASVKEIYAAEMQARVSETDAEIAALRAERNEADRGRGTALRQLCDLKSKLRALVIE
jgi:hypothetical protein